MMIRDLDISLYGTMHPVKSFGEQVRAAVENKYNIKICDDK